MSRIKINYTPAQLLDIARQKEALKLAGRARRKALKATISQSGWKKFEGDQLPEQACWSKSVYSTDPKGQYIFKYGGSWWANFTYYRGDNPETATEWIIPTDNGGSYKVGAEYMLWQMPSGNAQACWSSASLKRSIKSLLTRGVTVADPDYQT